MVVHETNEAERNGGLPLHYEPGLRYETLTHYRALNCLSNDIKVLFSDYNFICDITATAFHSDNADTVNSLLFQASEMRPPQQTSQVFFGHRLLAI